MKKIVALILAFLCLTGCSFNVEKQKETPTDKVKAFLDNYKSVSDDVKEQLAEVVEKEETMTAAQKEIYKDIMKKHYQGLMYDIKEEKINGDTAVVTVEITVNDHTKTLRDSKKHLEEHPDEFVDANKEYSVELYNDYLLEQLKGNTQTVTYTLDLTLSKKDKEWVLDELSEEEESKIHGTYEY